MIDSVCYEGETGKVELVPSKPSDTLILDDKGETIITIFPDGRVKLHVEENPDWTPKDFAEEFVKIVHEITGYSNEKTTAQV
jgi:ArsR family metal-binding transcriptional regulator